MTPQQIVFYVGIALFVIAFALAIWSVYTFFSLDIRNVMADLSGRKRASDAGAGRRGRTTGSAHARRYTDEAQATASEATEGYRYEDAEGAADTSVDTALRSISARSEIVNYDTRTVIDYKPGEAVDNRFYHRNAGQNSFNGEDVPTEVESVQSTQATTGASRASGSFRITRRIVFVHSGEVIVAG